MRLTTGLVDSIRYRPGWVLFLEITGGVMYFCVSTVGYDAYNLDAGPKYHTSHRFAVPEAMPNNDPQRWVFDRLLDVEKHEAMEFYKVAETHPYAPLHSRKAGRYYPLPG